jgi:DNA-3-methyladenine glycosylase II
MTGVLTIDYERARRQLMRGDPTLAAVIRRVGRCKLAEIPDSPPFMALAEAIASQQLSVKAADTIFGRFCDLFGPDRTPDPVRLLALDDTVLRSAGFSRAKVVFLRDLATHVVDKRLDLERMHEHEDGQVLAQLTAVKGIGQWTAEIFLMFRLKRPDVFPVDDLGLVKAAQRVYGLRQRPTRKRLLKMAEAWRPYRSVAAWYLWRSAALAAPNEERKPKNEDLERETENARPIGRNQQRKDQTARRNPPRHRQRNRRAR